MRKRVKAGQASGGAFYDGGQNPIGTLWIISHDKTLEFDSTDVKLLKDLAEFTASAYTELRRLGYLPSDDLKH